MPQERKAGKIHGWRSSRGYGLNIRNAYYPKGQASVTVKGSKSKNVAHLLRQEERLANTLEKIRLGEYISYLNHPRRMLWNNFAVGILRGLGGTLGATLVAGLFILLLKRLVVLNLPVIGGLIAEIIKWVNINGAVQ